MNAKQKKLTLGWLYPELMSTYGDRGNIFVLQKIAEENDIKMEVLRINQTSDPHLLTSCDLLFMGGAQDLQQEIVNKDLLENKGKILKQMVENETPGLYICGAFQFMGHYYKDAYGTEIPGLGIFDMYTQSYNTKPRLTGNIVVRPANGSELYVGFENHGGRTYLSKQTQTFANVVKGFGNNGEDETEGVHYKNSIGTYLHGPILPSNPSLAVSLIKTAIEEKYGDKISIHFDNTLSEKAKSVILKRLRVAV